MSYLYVAAALVIISSGAGAGTENNNIILSPDGRVESYYGVPVSVNIDRVGTLKLKHRRSSRYTGEGRTSRTEIISGRNGVELIVIFDRRGKMSSIRTRSPRAMDQRGVRVGTSFANVQAIWPCGKLYKGRSIEGGHRYARFMTGTNVIFEMSTTSFEDLSRLSVQEIKVVDYMTSETPQKNCFSKPR